MSMEGAMRLMKYKRSITVGCQAKRGRLYIAPFALFLTYCLCLLNTACMQDAIPPSNEPDIPVVNYASESLTRAAVVLVGSYTDNEDVSEYGFEMAEKSFTEGAINVISNPQIGDDGQFSHIAELTPGSVYVVRTYVSNGKTRKYSKEITVKAPTTSVATLSEVSFSHGFLRASVIDDGGRTVREVGFCWSESAEQGAIKRNRAKAQLKDDNTFSLDLSQFEWDKVYHVLAYAENSIQTSDDAIGYSFSSFELAVTDDLTLDIADAAFEHYLTSHFDNNKDGMISYRELKSITDLSLSTDDVSTIDEIRFMPLLETLICTGSASGKGRLDSLDLSKNPSLRALSCDNNCISRLVLTQNPLLRQLSVNSNPLTTIDISCCPVLQLFDASCCQQLSTIYIAPSQVEIAPIQFKKEEKASFVLSPIAIIPIPDVNFRRYLVDNYDQNGDDQISVDEAASITDISVCSEYISTLSGIKFFENLTSLSCRGSMGSGAELSLGRLTELDVSQLPHLRYLDCAYNKLKTLLVSDNTNLVRLDCGANDLTSLDISNNEQLETLYCGYQHLTSLDISHNLALKLLHCPYNALNTLDVSQNTAIAFLDCGFNKLTSLDVSQNSALETLYCQGNLMTFLDISNNKKITEILCDNIPIPDAVFKAYLIENFDTDKDGSISIVEAAAITSISVTTDDIQSLEGIEFFLNLTELECEGSSNYSGSLPLLDVSKNTKLQLLYCTDNQLTHIDVSNNPELRKFSCIRNHLSELDVSHNPKLYWFWCAANQLTEIDVTNNPNLLVFSCWSNSISSLDLNNNQKIQILGCENNQLTSLDVSHLPDLDYLDCSGNQLTGLDVSLNTELATLECSNNRLSSLDLSQNTLLTGVNCSNNLLSSLDVSQNTQLTSLRCTNNTILSLDVSNNLELTRLYCQNNPSLSEIWLKTGQTIEDFSYSSSVSTIYYK